MLFKIIYNPEVFLEIQEIVDWYNGQQSGLGNRFFQVLKENLTQLPRYASLFAVRYDDIRCMPVRKFPYLIHYRIDETKKVIQVEAIQSTYRTPRT